MSVLQLHKQTLRRKERRKFSPEAARQHELAWVMYILEGAAANLAHALAVNAYTMTQKDLALVRRVKRDTEKSSRAVHEAMTP